MTVEEEDEEEHRQGGGKEEMMISFRLIGLVDMFAARL